MCSALRMEMEMEEPGGSDMLELWRWGVIGYNKKLEDGLWGRQQVVGAKQIDLPLYRRDLQNMSGK